jgi:O-antigen/teichoic acid export membrane protein
MAEYLTRQPGVARAIYNTGLKTQGLIAIGLTVCGLVLAFLAGDPRYKWVSVLLVASMAPRMLAFIPSQANNAAEMVKLNTLPALLGGLLNIALTLFSLWIGWGLTGVAGGLAAGATLEAFLKTRSVRRWLGDTAAEPIPPELRKRMFSYSGQGVILLLLNVIVWDRSDLVILKMMNHDIRQIAFFSISFNITERLLMIPGVFSGSLGLTMMAQLGRDQKRINQLAVDGAAYAFLVGLPLLAGIACVTRPAVLLLYGRHFEAMIPVLTAAAILAIPKTLLAPATVLLQAQEEQRHMIVVGVVCGAVDVALDFLLTPAYGAFGAALANGLAQGAATAALWQRVHRVSGPKLDRAKLLKILLSGLSMSLAVVIVSRLIPNYAGLFCSIFCGVLVWFGMLRVSRAIDGKDAERFLAAGRSLPGPARRSLARCVRFLNAGPVSDRPAS